MKYPACTAFVLCCLLTVACGGPASEPVEPEPAATKETEAASETTYEPAYPEDVSSEELSDEDRSQQEGAAHTHDDGTTHGDHDHGDDEDHGHDQGH